MDGIKKQIALANKIEDFTEIKHLHRYEDNFWTEELSSPRDIRSLNDNNWVIWTRTYAPIPTKNVNLKELNSLDAMSKKTKMGSILDEEEDFVIKTGASTSSQGASTVGVSPSPSSSSSMKKDGVSSSSSSSSTSTTSTGSGGTTTAASTTSGSSTGSGASSSTAKRDTSAASSDIYSDRYKISLNAVKIAAMNYVSQCRNDLFFPDGIEEGALTEREYQILVDLLLDEDSYVISLYHNFKDDPRLFVKYARKKAQDFIKREKEREKEKKKAAAASSSSSAPTASTSPSGIMEAVVAGPSTQWQSLSEEERRKMKLADLISEYRTGERLAEEIAHPETKQDDKTSKREESTQTAQVTTTI